MSNDVLCWDSLSFSVCLSRTHIHSLHLSITHAYFQDAWTDCDIRDLADACHILCWGSVQWVNSYYIQVYGLCDKRFWERVHFLLVWILKLRFDLAMITIATHKMLHTETYSYDCKSWMRVGVGGSKGTDNTISPTTNHTFLDCKLVLISVSYYIMHMYLLMNLSRFCCLRLQSIIIPCSET